MRYIALLFILLQLNFCSAFSTPMLTSVKASTLIELVSAEDIDYTYFTENDTFQDFIIEYPHLTDSQYPDRFKAVNELITDVNRSYISQFNLSGRPLGGLTYRIAYMNSKFICIIFSFLYMESGSAHPCIYEYTLNLDLEKSVPVGFSDFYEVSDELVEHVINEKYLFSYAGKDMIPSISTSEMFDMITENMPLNTAQYSDWLQNSDQILPLPTSNVYTYYDEKEVTIIVPVLYVLGSYVEFVIPYEDIKGFLR